MNIPPETPITIESILHGRQLFQKMECWKCHGPAGHGDGPSAATLTDSKDNPIRPYNFSTGSRFICGETNQDLYRIFMTGLDGSPMPSFADVIQPNDAWDLVHFLRTLQAVDTNQELTIWQAYKAAHGADLKPIGPDSAGGGTVIPDAGGTHPMRIEISIAALGLHDGMGSGLMVLQRPPRAPARSPAR